MKCRKIARDKPLASSDLFTVIGQEPALIITTQDHLVFAIGDLSTYATGEDINKSVNAL